MYKIKSNLMTKPIVFFTALVLGVCLLSPAKAEVRFGKNVRVGGHDASNQTFDKNNRGEYYIYENDPKSPGCRMRKNADGSKTKECHLKRKKTRN